MDKELSAVMEYLELALASKGANPAALSESAPRVLAEAACSVQETPMEF